MPENERNGSAWTYPVSRRVSVRSLVLLVLGMVALLGCNEFVGWIWSGQHSQRTMNFETAVLILEDDAATEDEKHSAANRMFHFGSTAAGKLRELGKSDSDVLRRVSAVLTKALKREVDGNHQSRPKDR